MLKKYLSLPSLLLITGFVLLGIHKILVIPVNVQLVIFFAGILLLGLPHGAADVLVATLNARKTSKKFSFKNFLTSYLLKLVLFGLGFYFFPILATILFVVIAAFHFGETDLFYIRTETLTGRVFVFLYGMMILVLILLIHLQDIIPLLELIDDSWKDNYLLKLAETNRIAIIFLSLFLFFISAFIYFIKHPESIGASGGFIIHLLFLFILLYELPFIVGFSFYFICWHSVLSLHKIRSYLVSPGRFSNREFLKQVGIYSSIAVAGIIMAALFGFVLLDSNALVTAVILGLAVLTAPHMEVMHEMYAALRRSGYPGVLPK
jgi:beta-carotene 15,15'-dioxygenase